jgi:hypothetical protein
LVAQALSGMIRLAPPAGELGGVAVPTTTVAPVQLLSNSPGVPIAVNIVTYPVPSVHRT